MISNIQIKTIKGYERVLDFYYLCSCGRVVSTKGHTKILKNYVDKNNQTIVQLRHEDKERRNLSVKLIMRKAKEMI